MDRHVERGPHSSARTGLARKPSTPASTARDTTGASVWLVSMTTGHGETVMTSRAACTPSPSGRPTAITATSGRYLSRRRRTSSARLPLPTTCPPWAATASATAARDGA